MGVATGALRDASAEASAVPALDVASELVNHLMGRTIQVRARVGDTLAVPTWRRPLRYQTVSGTVRAEGVYHGGVDVLDRPAAQDAAARVERDKSMPRAAYALSPLINCPTSWGSSSKRSEKQMGGRRAAADGPLVRCLRVGSLP